MNNGLIWTFDSSSGTSGQPNQQSQICPNLIGVQNSNQAGSLGYTGSQGNQLNGTNTWLVDVVNDFEWTLSPRGQSDTARLDVPYISLVENRLKTNSLIAQFAYFAQTAVAKNPAVQQYISNLSQSTQNNLTQAVANNPNGLTGKVAAQIQNAFNNTSNFLSSSPVGGSNSVLDPYNGLYIIEPTGWQYNLPYFTNTNNELGNQFGTDMGVVGKMFGINDAVQGFGDLVESAAGLANLTQPGTYIEKAQFYQFQPQGDTINLTFPLFNTMTYNDVIRNWQLIYLLIYQNRPNRRTRDLIDPAPLYEVSIPGVKYTPYAYISNLSVEFMGARRTMTLSINNVGDIQTIIPDAYRVSITLQSLVMETKNFLYASLTEKQNLITTSSSTTNAAGQTTINSGNSQPLTSPLPTLSPTQNIDATDPYGNTG